MAYFADTNGGTIWRQPLDEKDGWPVGEREVFIDCSKEGVHADGAVTDSHGNLWNAQWGSSRIACYNPQGKFQFAANFPAKQISCPVFGGLNMATLYATSATESLSQEALENQPNAGKTFSVEGLGFGKPENQVKFALVNQKKPKILAS